MFHRNMNVSRIPMSAWNLIGEKAHVITPAASVIPTSATTLPVNWTAFLYASGSEAPVGERRGGRDDAIERRGLVIGEIRDHRHHRALGVEEILVVHRRLLRRVVQHVLVAIDRQPLRVALERAGGDLAYRIGKRYRG